MLADAKNLMLYFVSNLAPIIVYVKFMIQNNITLENIFLYLMLNFSIII